MSVVIASLVGLIVGGAMGSLGGGGAIITVPVLVYVLGEGVHQATTTSMVVGGLSATVALLAYARRHQVQWSYGLAFGLLGIIGTQIGAVVANHLPADQLLWAFAGLLAVVSVLMWLRADPEVSLDRELEAPADASHTDLANSLWWQSGVRGIAVVALAAPLVGMLTGIFGVGGGFAIVPALVLGLRFPMRLAVGTSLLVIALNNATALVGRLRGEIVLDWPIVIALTLGAMIGSLLAARLTARVSPALLQRAFAVLLLVIAAYVAARSMVDQ